MRMSPLDKKLVDKKLAGSDAVPDQMVTRVSPARRSWRPLGWARLAAFRPARALLDLLPALVPALLFLPLVLAPPINHDVAAVLEFSQRWLAGEHLYSDLIDVNPPLIFVLNLLPAAIATATPLSAVVALQLCLLILGGVCWWLSLRVRDRPAEGLAERALLDALPVLFVLGGGYDFGQREHLMAVAALPYVLCAARRAGGERPRGRFAVTVIAALGFALKPHFLALPVLVELGVLIGRLPPGALLWFARRGLGRAFGRWVRDPLPWVMAAVWALYLACLPFFFADYLGVVLPLVWDFYLNLGGLTAWQVLLVPRMATAVSLLLPALWIAFRRPAGRMGAKGAALPRLLGLAALGGVAAAVTQHKGWSYHIVPIEFFASALATLTAARWLDRTRATERTSGTSVAGIRRQRGGRANGAAGTGSGGGTRAGALAWHLSGLSGGELCRRAQHAAHDECLAAAGRL